MSNMSYCRFENTSRDLQDCIDAVEYDLENGEVDDVAEFRANLSESERVAFDRMLHLCADFVNIFES